MYYNEKLVEFIDNELPEEEKQGLFSALAGSEALREDLKIMMLVKNGIENNMNEFSEPSGLSDNIFTTLGYSNPAELAEPEYSRSSVITSGVVISLVTSLLILIFTLIVINPSEDFKLALPAISSVAAGEFDRQSNSVINNENSLGQNLANPDIKDRTIRDSKSTNVVSGRGTVKHSKTSIIGELPASSLSLSVTDTVNSGNSQKDSVTEAYTEISTVTTEPETELAFNEVEIDFPPTDDSVWVMDDKGGSYIPKKWSVESSFTYNYFVSGSGLTNSNTSLFGNPGVTMFYNFNEDISLGAGYSNDFFRVDDGLYRTNSFGIALRLAGKRFGDFKPACRIQFGGNDLGALLKLSTGIEYIQSSNTAFFLSIDYQNLFVLNRIDLKDCKKIGFSIGFKYSF